jgi:hypothetical protein
MKLRILLPAAVLINVSATSIGYSSFGVAPIEVHEIHVDSPPSILLLYGYNTGNPFSIPAQPDEPYLQHLLYLFLNIF